MKIKRSRRFYINVIISLVISLTMVLPMILGMMGYDIFNRRPVPEPVKVISVWVVSRQWLLYFLMVFILMMVNTTSNARVKGWQKILAGIAVTVAFYFIFPLFRPTPPGPGPSDFRSDRLPPSMEQARPVFPGERGTEYKIRPERSFGLNYRMMTEFLFILIITTLIGKVLELVSLKQQMQLENETLRSENLQNRYDVLLNQINPHFFFNSLNSLSSLVREGRNEKALKYIDELSNTYRYAIQSSGKELVTVAEELESLNAYSYLLQIRFEDKLFIEMEIDNSALRMLLPVLSLQPLIENVVKHNIISTEAPLTITITGNHDCITVLNPLRPRDAARDRNGTGLRNLATRYRLLTGKDLIIEEGSALFSVTLPLTKPEDI
jgi:hypothetical protein